MTLPKGLKMEKKNNNIGAIWEGQTQSGLQKLSIKIEIDGKSYNVTALRNRFKEGIEARPDWNILPMREMKSQPQPKNDVQEVDAPPF